MTNIRRLWSAVLLVAVLMLGVTVALAQEDGTHVVQPGETLNQIARQYGVSVEDLAFANGITNPNLIYAGQVLTIPGAGSGGERVTYTVVRGDTLFSIARRFGTTVDALVELNNLADPSRISAGQVLVISEGAPSTATPEPTTETPTPEPGETVTYVVQPGDTLGAIALRFGVTSRSK